MIRVSTTLKKLREGIEDVAPDGYNTEQQLEAMRAARAADAAAIRPSAWAELRQLLDGGADLVARARTHGRRRCAST